MDSLLEKIYRLDKEDCADCARHLMLGGGTRGGPVLVRGKGTRVYDPDGKDYIECTSQSWAMYLGFANEDINRVARNGVKNKRRRWDSICPLFVNSLKTYIWHLTPIKTRIQKASSIYCS